MHFKSLLEKSQETAVKKHLAEVLTQLAKTKANLVWLEAYDLWKHEKFY